MMWRHVIVCSFLCLLQHTYLLAQFEQDTVITLLTCDAGDDLYSIFGHSAVRVKTPEHDLVFNYGTFNFNQPGFYTKFMRGKLDYQLSVNEYGSFLLDYHDEKRSVTEQVFSIDNTLKQHFVQYLYTNAQPENRSYKYDFFYDNCATRIRDLCQSCPDFKLVRMQEEQLSFRNLLHQYLAYSPWLRLGIDMIIGSRADHIATDSEKTFLPDYLMMYLSNASCGSSQLLSAPNQVLMFDDEKKSRMQVTPFTPTVIVILIATIMMLLYYTKKFNGLDLIIKSVYFLVIISGIVICFLWFFTDHQATKINFNLLWAHPLVLLAFADRLDKRILLLLCAVTLLSMIGMLTGLIPQYPPSVPIMSFVSFTYILHYMIRIQNKSSVKNIST